jgi:hypothetical protein
MPLYLNTIGNSNVAIGICGRCSLKFPLVDLHPDPNSPGLMVCGTPGMMVSKGRWVGGYGCADMFDPWRLPPPTPEDITLEYPRPDTDLTTTSVAPGSDLWPPSSFPDDGLQANQQPSDGNNTFNIVPIPPVNPIPPGAWSTSQGGYWTTTQGGYWTTI